MTATDINTRPEVGTEVRIKERAYVHGGAIGVVTRHFPVDGFSVRITDFTHTANPEQGDTDGGNPGWTFFSGDVEVIEEEEERPYQGGDIVRVIDASGDGRATLGELLRVMTVGDRLPYSGDVLLGLAASNGEARGLYTHRVELVSPVEDPLARWELELLGWGDAENPRAPHQGEFKVGDRVYGLNAMQYGTVTNVDAGAIDLRTDGGAHLTWRLRTPIALVERPSRERPPAGTIVQAVRDGANCIDVLAGDLLVLDDDDWGATIIEGDSGWALSGNLDDIERKGFRVVPEDEQGIGNGVVFSVKRWQPGDRVRVARSGYLSDELQAGARGVVSETPHEHPKYVSVHIEGYSSPGGAGWSFRQDALEADTLQAGDILTSRAELDSLPVGSLIQPSWSQGPRFKSDIGWHGSQAGEVLPLTPSLVGDGYNTAILLYVPEV